MRSLFIVLFSLSIPVLYAQKCSYTILEKDSTILIIDTILIESGTHFYIEILEELPHHPYYLKFYWKNISDSTICTLFGTEGVIVPITKKIYVQPGKTELSVYQFHNVREYGGGFSQVGHIRSYKTDAASENWSSTLIYQWFMVSGTWKR